MKFVSILFMTTLLFVTCTKKDPIIPNEEELITELKYTLTPSNGDGETVILSFVDLDGDGGTDPIIKGGTLVSNKTYTGVLTLFSDSENITNEIEEENEEHQFFFVPNVPNLDIIYDDEDANGNPIGLKSIVKTGTADAGMITITLKHEPDKFASGVANGDITNAGGATDIEVDFPINVE